MGYILKKTSGLISTRVTDIGRKYISQGNFNISFFQIGDSEIKYDIPSDYSIINNNILLPSFNAQNDTGTPQSNKENIKYPYYLDVVSGNTYGLPYMDSRSEAVYNTSSIKGFFVTGETTDWAAQISSAYTVTSNYRVSMGSFTGQTELTITLADSICSDAVKTPSVGDFITIFFDGEGDCQKINPNYPILTYKIQSISPDTVDVDEPEITLTLDRNLPDYSAYASIGDYAKCLIYPSGMTELYDFITPWYNWGGDVINYETTCDNSPNDSTLIWNMNIPWSETPAGISDVTHETYEKYNSVTYIGTKELLGYNSVSGGVDTGEVFYYNSYKEKIVNPAKNQKAIAIIHYTNNSIDNVYGEKFATVPYDANNPTDETGLAKHFKLHIPTLMWHKSNNKTMGETFYIDPEGYDLCKPYYIRSSKNDDMNDPGIRYFHLWDTNPDSNNNLNRVGKVFPDQHLVVIDDEELISALSYKSNRNWTLPAPKLSLISPNVCFDSSSDGILSGSTERLWVTYIFESTGFTNSLHCNYYTYIDGPSQANSIAQNVAVRFGSEFPFMSTGTLSGFTANYFKIVCQKTKVDEKPLPDAWIEIDYTTQLESDKIGDYINPNSMVSSTFIIDNDTYVSGSTYDLSNYIDIPENGQVSKLNFGDEYYFYGNIETDISATIYEMRYLITLNDNQYKSSSNPTWSTNITPYITEIGLYNSKKELMVLSKLQSPQKRTGIQQFTIKLDF